MKTYDKNIWKPGLKVRFIGGESPTGYGSGMWTVGKVYETVTTPNWYRDDPNYAPDAMFTDDDNDQTFMDLCCFEPVGENEMEETLYVIGMQRKSDGKVFLSDTPKNPYTNFEVAKTEVERRARDLSDAYVYFVFELIPVMSAESQEPPIKRNWYPKV